MSKLSKDISDYIEAENAVKSILDPKELQAFIKGERREQILEIAVFRLNALKKGEQPGPITQQTHEFKGPGIEGTKSFITGEDIVKAIDKADEKKVVDLERKAADEKAALDKAKLDADAAVPRSYVTGEDVVKKMRAEGKAI